MILTAMISSFPVFLHPYGMWVLLGIHSIYPFWAPSYGRFTIIIISYKMVISLKCHYFFLKIMIIVYFMDNLTTQVTKLDDKLNGGSPQKSESLPPEIIPNIIPEIPPNGYPSDYHQFPSVSKSPKPSPKSPPFSQMFIIFKHEINIKKPSGYWGILGYPREWNPTEASPNIASPCQVRHGRADITSSGSWPLEGHLLKM